MGCTLCRTLCTEPVWNLCISVGRVGTSLQPHWLPRSLPSFRPQTGTLDLASSAMQGNIAPNQVAQAAAASALPSLLQLVWACYGPIRWLLQLATKGNAGWTTRYLPLDRTRLGWGILGCCAGILDRSQLIWLAPGYLHFVVSAASVVLLLRLCSNISRCKKWSELFCFVCWTTTNLVALVLSIVGAVYCWEAQHLIQCLSCIVLTWEYLVVKWVVDEWVKRFGSQALTSQEGSVRQMFSVEGHSLYWWNCIFN